HQITPTDSHLVNERAHIDEPLAAKNPTTDHPVKRAALAQLAGTLWHHARAMHVLARQSAPLARFEACANPLSEVFDRIAANAKLDEMERHRMPRAWPPTLYPCPACGGGIKGGGCRAGSSVYCAGGTICNGPDRVPSTAEAWRRDGVSGTGLLL